MRQERSRRDGGLSGGGPGTNGRRLIVVLGIVATLMVALVVYREWPSWVAEAGQELLDAVTGRLRRTWADIGGRWFTLAAVVAAVAVGALVSRRSRTLGIVIVEAAVAIGAIAVLIGPAGW